MIRSSPYRPPHGMFDLGLGILGIIFFLGSRDSLRRYYLRTGQLLRSQQGGGEKKTPRNQEA